MAVAKSQRISEAFGPQRPTQQGREFRAPRTMMTEAEREQLKLGRDRMIAQTVLDAVSQATKLGLGIGNMVQESNLADRTIAARKEMQAAGIEADVQEAQRKRDEPTRRLEQLQRELAAVDRPATDAQPIGRRVEQQPEAAPPADQAPSAGVFDSQVLQAISNFKKGKGVFPSLNRQIAQALKEGSITQGDNPSQRAEYESLKTASERASFVAKQLAEADSPEVRQRVTDAVTQSSNPEQRRAVAIEADPAAMFDPGLQKAVEEIGSAKDGAEMTRALNNYRIAAQDASKGRIISELPDLDEGEMYADISFKDLVETYRNLSVARQAAERRGDQAEVNRLDQAMRAVRRPSVYMRTRDVITAVMDNKFNLPPAVNVELLMAAAESKFEGTPFKFPTTAPKGTGRSTRRNQDPNNRRDTPGELGIHEAYVSAITGKKGRALRKAIGSTDQAGARARNMAKATRTGEVAKRVRRWAKKYAAVLGISPEDVDGMGIKKINQIYLKQGFLSPSKPSETDKGPGRQDLFRVINPILQDNDVTNALLVEATDSAGNLLDGYEGKVRAYLNLLPLKKIAILAYGKNSEAARMPDDEQTLLALKEKGGKADAIKTILNKFKSALPSK